MRERNAAGDDAQSSETIQLPTEPSTLQDAVALLIRLSATLPGYHDRPAQQVMLKCVYEALSGVAGKRHLLIEAQTGTGKTFAYLIGAIIAAHASGRKLVVSTATVALEEQLVEHVLPALQPHIRFPLRIAMAKGRHRYLCLPRLTHAMASSPGPQADILGDLARNLADGWDGDRDHLDRTVEHELWKSVVIDQRSCSARRCEWYQECPYFRARDRINDADLIVTNHDLVIADMDAGGGVLLPRPEETLYVFDEGHHLPDRTRQGFARHIRIESFQASLEWIPKDLEPIGRDRLDIETNLLVSSAAHAARDLHRSIERLLSGFSNFGPLMIPEVEQVSRYEFSESQTNGEFDTIVSHLEEESTRLEFTLAILHGRVAALRGHGALTADDAESVLLAIGAHRSRVHRHVELWRSLGQRSDPGQSAACWVESGEQDGAVGHRVSHIPITVADRLRRVLWDRAAGTVVTGATLAGRSGFSVIREELGLNDRDDVDEQIMPPTLDATRATLHVPEMITTPSDRTAHLQEVTEMLPGLLADTGSALVLFASWEDLRLVLDQLPEALRVDILAQNDLPRARLLARHRERVAAGQRSILAGVAGLAEGLDLPGDLCSHLVVTRIPFPPATDPLWAARSRLVEASGGNAFFDLVIPEVARRLVHATGRLLRHERDIGKITILDRRILDKGYGKALRRALPTYPTTSTTVVTAPIVAKKPQP